MRVPKPRYSKEEFARRGDEIYDREIGPHIGRVRLFCDDATR